MEHQEYTQTGTSVITLRKVGFLAIAILVFIATYGVLVTYDLVPNGSVTQVKAETPMGTLQGVHVAVATEYPVKITIPTLNLEVGVANPTTAEPAVLDANLLKGAVRYPTSGLLGGEGSNVVIFAHSSYLPIVHNQAYKAFDGIQTMKVGEKIYVAGTDRVYVYEVEGVHQADATTAGIPLSVEGNKLTLITCDSFSSKSGRFVVLANFVESYAYKA